MFICVKSRDFSFLNNSPLTGGNFRIGTVYKILGQVIMTAFVVTLTLSNGLLP